MACAPRLLVRLLKAQNGSNPEKNGTKTILVSLEAEFFVEQHIQNPLKSAPGGGGGGEVVSTLCIFKLMYFQVTSKTLKIKKLTKLGVDIVSDEISIPCNFGDRKHQGFCDTLSLKLGFEYF